MTHSEKARTIATNARRVVGSAMARTSATTSSPNVQRSLASDLCCSSLMPLVERWQLTAWRITRSRFMYESETSMLSTM